MSVYSRGTSMLAGVTALFLMQSPAFAATYDAVTGFALTSNPNGVWSYRQRGGILTAPSTLLPTASTSGSLDTWAQGSAAPGIIHNHGAFSDDTVITYDPAQLIEQAGNGGFPDLSFTAPETGVYDLNATFYGIIDNGSGTNNVYVYQGATSLFSGSVHGYYGGGGASSGPSPIVNSNAVVSLAAGNTLDFLVSGSNPVGLTVSITEEDTPEPGGLALLVGLVISGGVFARRHRR